MLTSLMVPLDGSDFAENALPLAVSLARVKNAPIHLVHVHPTPIPDHFLVGAHIEGMDLAQFEAQARQNGEEYLEGVAERLRADGLTVHTHLLDGSVAAALAHCAEDVDAGLILVTSHGHTGMTRMWLGSTTDALVRRTDHPVLLVHPDEDHPAPGGADQIDRILVPLDGSRRSAKILGPAADLAEATGASLLLLHVVSSADFIGGGVLPVLIQSVAEAQEQARAHLEVLAEPLRAQGLEPEVMVVDSEQPARSICDVARRRDADLIALTTHGYGGLKRAVLGSVTDKVLRGSHVPLLLYRPEDDAEE